MKKKVTIMLSCTHFIIEQIENVIFIPQVGDIRKCPECKQEKEILKVSQPYAYEEKATRD